MKESDLRNDVGVVCMVKVGNAVKIGFTTDLDSRLSDIQVCNSKKVKLVAFSEGVTIEDEGWAHEQLKNSHVRGEWFKITEEVIEAVYAFEFAVSFK